MKLSKKQIIIIIVAAILVIFLAWGVVATIMVVNAIKSDKQDQTANGDIINVVNDNQDNNLPATDSTNTDEDTYYVNKNVSSFYRPDIVDRNGEIV